MLTTTGANNSNAAFTQRLFIIINKSKTMTGSHALVVKETDFLQSQVESYFQS